ncbi:hypothetical protein HPB47_002138, partial [Ixodes persulcatus]
IVEFRRLSGSLSLVDALFESARHSETSVSESVGKEPRHCSSVAVENIVATVNLCCRLDLRRIALMARNAEYNPRRFAAVIMRIREPRTTALLFNSGKVVCTGAKSEFHSRVAARKFARITQKLGFDAQFSDFKIQNIVASADVGFLIKLEALALNHPQFSCYEPELFPGLVYRMVRPSVLLLVFVSGKVVLTGAKVRHQLYQAFDNIYPILEKYKSAGYRMPVQRSPPRARSASPIPSPVRRQLSAEPKTRTSRRIKGEDPEYGLLLDKPKPKETTMANQAQTSAASAVVYLPRQPGVTTLATSGSDLGIREIIREVVQEELKKLLSAAARPASLFIAEVVREEV